jgi:biopolymer transport protein ExbB/TolQ
MKKTSHLVAGDERGLLVTLLIAAALVVSFYFALQKLVDPNAWTHDFFFKRSFVQWVLLSAFAIGMVHLVRRLFPWWHEKRAMRQLQENPNELSSDTLVGRRWRQIRAVCEEHGRKNLGQHLKSLAEHDEAEIDAAYRIPSDVVQILPLMGFFGTVFGLSHGLYRSFLATGGTNTKDFAKAIAIAFDNTLLGLALTIILFVLLSILRKREEAILLQLNLVANDVVTETAEEQVKDPLQIAIEELNKTIVTLESSLKSLGTEVEKSRNVLESPTDSLKELIRTHTTSAAEAVVNKLISLQHEEYGKLGNTILSQLKDQANKLLDIVGQRTLAFTQLGDPMRVQISEINSKLATFSTTAQSISDAISALTQALAQRESLLLGNLQNSLAAHSQEIKSEIRQPRTIKFVEAPQLPDGDGSAFKR